MMSLLPVFVGRDFLSSDPQPLLLLLLGLWLVLVGEFEELGRGVLVEGVGELGDRGGDLETLVEDDLLSLEANVCWPLDEAGHVLFGLHILAWGTREVFEKKEIKNKLHGNAPMPKFLGVASKRGFLVTLLDLEALKGAGAGFFPDLGFGWRAGHRDESQSRTRKYASGPVSEL